MSRRGKILCFTAPIITVFAVYVIMSSGVWDVAMLKHGYVTYAVDCEIGQAAVDGAHDAFESWDDANVNITLVASETWAEADIRVTRMDAPVAALNPINGCACMGVSPWCPELDSVLFGCPIPKGGTIGLIVNNPDMNEMQYPYERALMRDLVAHEFGHNLGISHDIFNRSHMMYGGLAMYPHTDRGYVIPERIAGDDTVLVASPDKAFTESCVMP